MAFIMLKILSQLNVKCDNMFQFPCINQIQNTHVINKCTLIFITCFIHNAVTQLTKFICFYSCNININMTMAGLPAD
jgi:hypothetical protein